MINNILKKIEKANEVQKVELEKHEVELGAAQDLEKELFAKSLFALNLDTYKDGRVVVKGCSKESVPTDSYVKLTTLLQPIVKSLFFGEPCSTVPIYKKKITT